jgi:hypothetical protein
MCYDNAWVTSEPTIQANSSIISSTLRFSETEFIQVNHLFKNADKIIPPSASFCVL